MHLSQTHTEFFFFLQKIIWYTDAKKTQKNTNNFFSQIKISDFIFSCPQTESSYKGTLVEQRHGRVGRP